MASSQNRQRKQLEKKKKKRNEKHQQLVVRPNAGLADQLLARSKAPVHECFVSANLQAHGIGQVLISRRSASGEIALGVVEGMNTKAKVALRKSYGFKTTEVYKTVLYHELAKLPEHELAHQFC